MFRMISTFAVLFAVFFLGIQFIRHMTGKEQWELTKMLAYSIMCATLSVAALVAVVVMF